VSFQISLGIPFLKKTEFILILSALEKVASPASLLRPYQADQGGNRLGQLLSFLGKNLHADDDQDHANRICKWPANNRKNQKLGIAF
jgi:hypothetical protein